MDIKGLFRAFVFLVLVNLPLGKLSVLKIGVIVSQPETHGPIINMALEYINSHPDLLSGFTLTADIRYVRDELDKMTHIRTVCRLLDTGIIALVGPLTSTAVKVTQPIASGLHIPQIAPIATDPTLSTSTWDYPYLLKMSPMDKLQSESIVDLMRTYGWTRVATISSNTDYGRQGLEEFHKLVIANRWVILRLETFAVNPNLGLINATQQLLDIKNSGARVVVLNSEELPGWIVLGQAKAHGMFGKGWAWVVTDAISMRSTAITLDGATNKFDELLRKALMSNLPLYHQKNVSDCVSVTAEFEGLLGTLVSTVDDPTQSVYKSFKKRWNATFGSYHKPTVFSRVLFDSVLTVGYALDDYISDGNTLVPPDSSSFYPGVCSSDVNMWKNGSALLDYFLQVQGWGSSYYINFTDHHLPWWSRYDVVNLNNHGWEKVSEWSPERRGTGLLIPEPILFPGRTNDIPEDFDINASTLVIRVTTILEKPFTMVHEKTGELYGLCIDLIKRIADELGFDFKIALVRDNAYGGLNRDTMEWNGMIKEILDGEVDAAVGPLFITNERADYVDFTKPWYDLGLDILLPLERPSRNLFDFFDPFDLPLWMAVIVSTYVCGFVVSICSFMSPFGFKGRYIQRQKKQDHKYRDRKNELNANNGVWFAFSSLMRQGPSTTPISVSGRIVSGFWWLAVTILTATYTANLTAHLTVERLDTGVTSLLELSGQTDIKYGTLNGTAVEAFFFENKADPYPKMYQFMKTYDTWMPNGSEAIQRVQDSFSGKSEKYAFIFDSTILEYAARNEPCITRTLGDLFRRVGYGIALKKRSHLTSRLNSVILRMRENGEIEALVDKWMQGPCLAQNESHTLGEQMTLWRMLGLFLVLVAGLMLGLILIICEYIFAGYRDVVEDQLQGRPHKSWWYHVKRRLHDTKEELQEMFCISTCCRRAYSLNDSRRFSVQFLHSSSTRRRASVASKSPRSRGGTSRERSISAKRRNSAINSVESNVILRGTRPIFNTHEHIMELCRKAEITVNGVMQSQVAASREQSKRDGASETNSTNGIIQTQAEAESGSDVPIEQDTGTDCGEKV